jgi:hypothetical protein
MDMRLQELVDAGWSNAYAHVPFSSPIDRDEIMEVEVAPRCDNTRGRGRHLLGGSDVADSKHETHSFVDPKRGIQAFCATCGGPLGPEHGVRDKMGNVEALLTALSERTYHENNPDAYPADVHRVNW